jgi:integrase
VGEKQYPTGVRPYGSGIQVRFSWDKKRYEPIWPRKPSPKNLAAASALRAEIILRAKSGILSLEYLADHFPEYAHAKEHSEANPKYLLCTLAQDFLDNSGMPANSRTSYRQQLNAYVMPELAQIDVRYCTEGDLVAWSRAQKFTSQSVRNLAYSALRKVMALAVSYGYISKSPAEVLKITKDNDTEPDPLTPEERDAVLAWLEKKYTGRQRSIYLYYVIGFWTGMRPSEMIALEQRDVMLSTGRVSVSKLISKGQVQAYTKTKKNRVVLMNEFSRRAFEELLELGKDHSVSHRLLWTYRAPEGFKSLTTFRDRLNQAFVESGIRVRSTYSMRHTYASVCLMAGITPAFVAQQLGNTVPVLLSRYAKWISSDADMLEMSKLGK